MYRLGIPFRMRKTRRVKSTEAIANCHIISCVQPREKNKYGIFRWTIVRHHTPQTRTVSILRIETPPPSFLFKVKYVSHIHRSEFLSISSSVKFDILQENYIRPEVSGYNVVGSKVHLFPFFVGFCFQVVFSTGSGNDLLTKRSQT